MGSFADIETNTTFLRCTWKRIIHKLLRTHTHAKRLRPLFFYSNNSYTLLSKILSDLAAQAVPLATLVAIAPCGAERTTFVGLAVIRVEVPAGRLAPILFTQLQLVGCSG